MGKDYLYSLFEPQSTAIVGSDDCIDSAGQVVLDNPLHSAFQCKIHPVTPSCQTMQGQKAHPSLSPFDLAVDLEDITTSSLSSSTPIDDRGQHDIKVIIILTARFGKSGCRPDRKQKRIKKSRQDRNQMIGPNSPGLMRPPFGLNTTFNKNSNTKSILISSKY